MTHVNLELLESRRLLSAGGIDLSFHLDTGGQDVASFAVMHDGRVVVPTSQVINNTTGLQQLEIRRYGKDGTLDPSFDVKVQGIDASGLNYVQRNITFDASDRMLVVFGGRLSRFDLRGAPDLSFARHGWVQLPTTTTADDLLVQRDGRIVIAGTLGSLENDENGNPTSDTIEPAVLRFNADGTTDTTFANQGKLSLRDPIDILFSDFNTNAAASRIVQDSSGRLIVVDDYGAVDAEFDGTISFDTHSIRRFNPDGSEDASFQRIDDVSRFTESNLKNGDIVDLAARPNGGIAFLFRPETDTAQLIELRSNGTLDTAFAQHGRLELNVEAWQMLLQSDGKIAIVETRFDNIANIIARVNRDGTFDSTWGDGGTAPVGAFELALQPDGALLARVDAPDSSGDHFQMRRVWRDDAPAAVLHSRTIAAASSRSQTFDVTYRDDGSVDLTTLDNRDLRITGPNGFVRYAKFDRVSSSGNNNGSIVARYKLAAPDGAWDSADNGIYSVRLMDQQVRDTQSNGAAARTIGQFKVQVSPASEPTARSERAMALSYDVNVLVDDLVDDLVDRVLESSPNHPGPAM